MEELIIGLIVGLSVIYLMRRYLRIFRSQTEDTCACGCSGCNQSSTCNPDIKSIEPRS